MGGEKEIASRQAHVLCPLCRLTCAGPTLTRPDDGSLKTDPAAGHLLLCFYNHM